MKLAALLLLAVFGCLAVPLSAHADKVDLMLVLAADVSRSIDDGEFDLQRKGYAAAMTDPRVLGAIAGGKYHAIVVTYVEWAGEQEEKTVVPWSVVRDGEGASVIAGAILKAPRAYLGRTAIGSAIEYAAAQFAAAPAEGGRRIIDVSGDGTSNSGLPVTGARDAATTRGITINGLAIINTQAGPGYAYHTNPPGGLPKYYRENVIGGPGAFLMVVENFSTFADAMARKLAAEIAGTPPRVRAALLERQ